MEPGLFKRYLHLLFPFTLFFITEARAIDRYPEWFLYPGRYQGLITGYSYRGIPAESVAENLYCAYHRCFAVGTLEIFDQEKNSRILKNSNYFYEYSPDSVSAIRGKLIEVDHFAVNMMTQDYIAAYSLDSVRSDGWSLLETKTLDTPNWIELSVFEDGAYFYGIGMYTSKGLENDAWQTAEEQSIFSILNYRMMKINQISSYRDGSQPVRDDYQKITIYEIRFLLENIQIMERYPDAQNQMFYVLSRIPKKNLTPLYK